MNPAQVLNELIARQIPFSIMEDHFIVPQGQATDLADEVERYSRVLARIVNESFQDPTPPVKNLGRSTERFRATLPLPKARRALIH